MAMLPPRNRLGALPPRRSIAEMLSEALQLHQSGRVGDAAPIYRQVLDRDPDQPAANHLLGLVHLQRGEAEDAVRLIRRAIRANSADPQYFTNLGVALNKLGRFVEAVEAFDRALALNPRLPGTLSNRGMALKGLGQHAASAASYRAAIDLHPVEPGIHGNLGNVLVEAGAFAEAEAAFRNAMRLQAWHPTSVGGLCMVFEETSRLEQAEALAREAVAAMPALPLFRYRLGRALSLLRRPEEAAEQFREAVRLKEDYGVAWYFLANSERRTEDDAELATLRALATAPGVAPEETVFANYALGRALADLGRHDESVAAFSAAHAARRQMSSERASDEIAGLRQRLEQFPEPLRGDSPGLSQAAPVFVVGLPRSGKTTVEMMLSATSGFQGVGEQRILPGLVAAALAEFGDRPAAWPATAWERIGADYARKAGSLVPAGIRPVDTFPPNFGLIGFILAALPRATIIHTRRNRPGQLVALLEKYVTGRGYAYTADIEGLAGYHEAYRALMARWHALYPQQIIDLDVADAAARQQFAGLLGLDPDVVDRQPETEPRANPWSPAEERNNRARQLAAWQRLHPGLAELSNPANW